MKFTQKYWLGTLVLILLCSFTKPSLATTEGYSIKLKIPEITDTVAYLAYHFGKKVYVQDTFEIDKKGNAVFQGSEPLPGGIYLAIIPGAKFFEFLYSGKEDEIAIEVNDTSNYINTIKFSNSPENENFNAYQRFLAEQQKKVGVLNTTLQGIEEGDSIPLLENQIKEENLKILNYRKEAIKDHEGTYFANILSAMSEPEIPEDIPLDDQKARFKYVKKHFWDSFNFEEQGLARTPIFHNKQEKYMENLTYKNPDSIIVSARKIIELARPNKELFKYSIISLTNKYEQSKIMGMDAVFVKLAEQYYLSGEADWADEDVLKKIRERVFRLKPNLLGKKGPEMLLEDTTGNSVSVHGIEADYLILHFWSYSCGHCKKTTPKYIDLYNKWKDKGVELLSICTKNDKKAWTKYIKENNLQWLNAYDPKSKTYMHQLYDVHSTPTVYLLDKDKIIVGKRIGPEQLDQMLEHYIGIDGENKGKKTEIAPIEIKEDTEEDE